ncbi:MFS transporter [Streptomyces sp. ME01-24h]|nr:MFS transporter [Streptomyces sp. ME19-03-3]MDX3355947.1 MFS transporter [Streptomyces sp. ME01-24h]
MRTYRELFRTREFTPLFLVSTGQVAAQTVSGLALSTLVYDATGSPLLSAVAMFGPSLAQVLGATTLLSAADRLPPRAALTAVAVLFAVGTAVSALPGVPIRVVFVILLVEGLVASLGGGVRYGLLHEILPKGGFLLGRSLLNMATGAMQVCGFAAGGLLLAALSPRAILLAGAGLYLAAATAALGGLRARPPRTGGRPSAAETWRTNAALLSARSRRHVYLALWVPNGLIVGCESLFVPYAPDHAGLLLAAAACGMLAGDTVAGRFVPPWWRERVGAALRLLLAAPYLLFALHPAPPLAAAVVALASVGYAASLLLQERLMALTPAELAGHALGLHSSGMLACQGLGAALAGAVAQHTSPGTAMTVVAATSVAVTLALAPGLRPDPGSAATPGASASGRARRPVR